MTNDASALLHERRASLALRSAAAILFAIACFWPTITDTMLIKLFADRQLAVPPEVVTYLRARVERSFEAKASIFLSSSEGFLARRLIPQTARRREVASRRDPLPTVAGSAALSPEM